MTLSSLIRRTTRLVWLRFWKKTLRARWALKETGFQIGGDQRASVMPSKKKVAWESKAKKAE